MSYLSPAKVTSPKDHWTLVGVIYDLGEHDWSLSLGEWDGTPCLASRWNGSLNDEKANKGNPISNFQPTWFVLPHFIANATLKELLMIHARGDTRVDIDLLHRAIKSLTQKQL